MIIIKKIINIGKKIVTIPDIEAFFGIYDYKDIVKLINQLRDNEEISPIISSKYNGMNPPLYNKYRINEKKVDYSEYEEEIKYLFPFNFNKDYYHKNLKKYLEDRDYIIKLVDYFRNKHSELKIPMSINERSFAIFGEEKFIKNGKGKTIIKNLGLEESCLNYYYTPEPFIYYSSNELNNQTILIIENKDPWYSMRRLMLKGKTKFFGLEIDTIIYGSGKFIESAFEEYELIDKDYLKQPKQVLYWGDIDYEGILIYERFKMRYQESFNISLFKNAYIKMLELSTPHLPLYKDKQNSNIDKIFLNELVPYNINILNIFEKGQYIPQEIINYKVLSEE